MHMKSNDSQIMSDIRTKCNEVEPLESSTAKYTGKDF